jgi:phage terminase large subunit
MELELKHTVVFSKVLRQIENNKRFIICQGGSRSSKTYSIIQVIIFLCLTTPNLSVSIVRKSFPSLRGSVLRDFVEIMTELGLYNLNNHNKTEQRYIFDNRSSVEFFSIDDAQKVRGRKRDICYCNEANELVYEDFLQLSLRTNKCLLLDFNPSDSDGFIYDLINDNRSVLIKSTYKDNIYLGKELVEEIENLINVDQNYYKIYALGERPIPRTRIYDHFKLYDRLPDKIDDVVYGIDFGFNHPVALIKCYICDTEIYVEELLYKSGLTSGDIINELNNLGIDKRKYIYADYARPEIIEDLRRVGYNMKEADKSVIDGINSVKSKVIWVNKAAVNLMDEYKKYSWKTKGDQIIDEPVKLYDDCMDALRYAIHSIKHKVNTSKLIKFY